MEHWYFNNRDRKHRIDWKDWASQIEKDGIWNTHFELDKLEMEDFITVALPGLLDRLSMPVFLLLEGRINAEEAIDMVRVDIIGERGRM